MPFTYDHPHPAVATDIAIFTVRDRALSVLLIRRAGQPFAGWWALPGGFLGPDEDLDSCARRELVEETGVDAPVLFSFGNFSDPKRDPRERVISVAYLALLPSGVPLAAGSDAAEAQWFGMGELPQLAFDHGKILEAALRALRARARELGMIFALLPERFSLNELQAAYEAVLGTAADKRNFRKVVLESGEIVETDAVAGGRHRPARLYRRLV
jgi:8-oxo-dGTP diphosphatase